MLRCLSSVFRISFSAAIPPPRASQVPPEYSHPACIRPSTPSATPRSPTIIRYAILPPLPPHTHHHTPRCAANAQSSSLWNASGACFKAVVNDGGGVPVHRFASARDPEQRSLLSYQLHHSGAKESPELTASRELPRDSMVSTRELSASPEDASAATAQVQSLIDSRDIQNIIKLMKDQPANYHVQLAALKGLEQLGSAPPGVQPDATRALIAKTGKDTAALCHYT